MKSKLGISAFILLVISGIIFSVYFGLSPRPIPKIKLSVIESPAVLAKAVQMRMAEEFKSSNILAFGFQPEHPQQLEVIHEWYSSKAVDVWLAEDSLQINPSLMSLESIDTKNNTDALVEKIQKANLEGKKVGLILPTVYSSQMVENNLIDVLKKRYQLTITSFSIVELLRQREQEKSAIIPCYVANTDPTGFGKLGCAILQQGRSLYRKKMPEGKQVAWMDQRGAYDYLIFYSN